MKNPKAQPRSQLIFDKRKTGISAEQILPQESSTSVKNVWGGHHIPNQLGWGGEYRNGQQHKEGGASNSSRDKFTASGDDSHHNNSTYQACGDDANSNGNHSLGWGGDNNSKHNNSSARGGDSSTNSTNSTTWGHGNSLSWGTNVTSSNRWGRMKNNDAIQNLK